MQHWYKKNQLLTQSIDPILKNWLFESSSLTAKLIALCGANFTVQVLSQNWQRLEYSEAKAMGFNQLQGALIRQVLLCDKNKPLVYAKTVLPISTVQGKLRRYTNLGNRPLGAMLFSDRTMRREAVEVSLLPKRPPALKFITDETLIWGRRSVFRVENKPLLVSEYFLPHLLNKSR